MCGTCTFFHPLVRSLLQRFFLLTHEQCLSAVQFDANGNQLPFQSCRLAQQCSSDRIEHVQQSRRNNREIVFILNTVGRARSGRSRTDLLLFGGICMRGTNCGSTRRIAWHKLWWHKLWCQDVGLRGTNCGGTGSIMYTRA